jgi:hypothetical protein
MATLVPLRVLRWFGFPTGACLTHLPSPRMQTPSLVLQDVRSNIDQIPSLALQDSSFLSCRSSPSPIRFRRYCTPFKGYSFSFPSRYSCAIGFGMYLGFPDNGRNVLQQYPMQHTLDTPNHPTCVGTRDYHPLRYGVPADLFSPCRCVRESKPHISTKLPWQIRFALCGFRSTLLPASHFDVFSSRY